MPTIEQRIASAERATVSFGVSGQVLSDTEQLPSLQALESQFTGAETGCAHPSAEGRTERSARKGRRRDEAGAQDVLDDRSSGQ